MKFHDFFKRRRLAAFQGSGDALTSDSFYTSQSGVSAMLTTCSVPVSHRCRTLSGALPRSFFGSLPLSVVEESVWPNI